MADEEFDAIRLAQQERNASNTGKVKSSRALDTSTQRTDSSTKASLTENMDTELYGKQSLDKFAGYNTSIAANDDEDEDMDGEEGGGSNRLIGQYTATSAQMNEFAHGATEEDDILDSREKQAQIASRETDYQKRRFERMGDDEGKSYRDVMAERELEREEQRVQKLVEDKKANGDIGVTEHEATLKITDGDKTPPREETTGQKRKKRWGEAEDVAMTDAAKVEETKTKKSRWDAAAGPDGASAAPAKRSRWDAAPAAGNTAPTPQAAPSAAAPGIVAFGTDISSRNAALSDEELDIMLPSEGYKILTPPPGYEPLRAPAKAIVDTSSSASAGGYGGFMMQEPESMRSNNKQLPTEIPGVGDLQFFKAEDMQYFSKLVDGADENEMDVAELKERKIMRLLLKVKNGTPPMRKTALRQITDNARQFGAGPLFNQILPLLMERTLEDQERHLLVKVIDRVLYKLDDLVRPFVHKILVVIEPLLIDQDYYARVEGREIISNLSKAAGLAHMISTMRPDIDHVDEYVRNTTARAFAVVASALGVPALLPFLRAVCRSKKSWQARHTGVKIVQQIPILMGCAILPHLKGLVDCIGDNLNDEQSKVRTVASLAIAALAEAANPYGIESFDDILNPLWTG